MRLPLFLHSPLTLFLLYYLSFNVLETHWLNYNLTFVCSLYSFLFDQKMILANLSLNFSDLGCLVSIIMNDCRESLEEMLFVMLVRQVVHQFSILILFPSPQDTLFIYQALPIILHHLEFVFLPHYVLDIILCPFQFKLLNPPPQLPHHLLLHAYFLQVMVEVCK